MNDTLTSLKNGFFRSPLFVFLLGQLALLLSAVVLFSVGWGKLSYQFTEIQEWRKYVDQRLEKMDNEGTNVGRYEMQATKATLDQHESRLKNVEQQTDKTNVIVEKISRIEEELKILNQNVKR
jgi:Tfp pilus assembly protein PilN